MDKDTSLEDTGTWAMGLLMAVFCLTGIILAAGARDDGMYVFGWSLAAFSTAFICNLLRTGLADANHPAKARTNG